MFNTYQPYGKYPTFFENAKAPFSDEGRFNRAITIYNYRTIPSLYTFFLATGLFAMYLILSIWIKRDFDNSAADIWFIIISVITFVVLIHYLFVTFVALSNHQGYIPITVPETPRAFQAS